MEIITKYFQAEKYEGVLFMLVGILAISFATYFYIKVKEPFYTGIAYPVMAVALIQIVVGLTVYIRSPKDIERMEKIIKSDQAAIKTLEIPRMQTVMKNFELYRLIELVLIAVSVALIVFFHVSALWKGVGCGLSIQAGLMLLLDYFAESRGKAYLEYLHTIMNGV